MVAYNTPIAATWHVNCAYEVKRYINLVFFILQHTRVHELKFKGKMRLIFQFQLILANRIKIKLRNLHRVYICLSRCVLLLNAGYFLLRYIFETLLRSYSTLLWPVSGHKIFCLGALSLVWFSGRVKLSNISFVIKQGCLVTKTKNWNIMKNGQGALIHIHTLLIQTMRQKV